jgi:general secretion pathway protein F
MKFHYEAANAKGKLERGELAAESEASAVQSLLARGLTATAITPIRAIPAAQFSSFRNRISTSDVALVTQQLAQLIQAGVPLADSYASVAAQATPERLRAALSDVAQRITRGESHSQALGAHSTIFSPLMRALVEAGSESGQLGPVMNQLGDYLDARDALQKKLIAAMAYPALVALVSFAVVLAMVTYVMPQVVAVFAQGKQALPWITQALIGLSNFVQAYWPLLLAICAAGIGGMIGLARLPATRGVWDRFVLGLPLFGKLVRELDMTRFLQTLAMLAGAGVPILNAFAAARKVVQRAPLRAAILEAENAIAQGAPITLALENTNQFPPMVTQLTANGEATGQLSAMLMRAARVSQQQVERRTTWMTALIEPALIVVMGAVVLILVLAVMLPIASINTIIK